jgi:2-polyprenyl-3-methyl-5-hydroxy-6-metoxy-1,4-benzoquinol methylase
MVQDSVIVAQTHLDSYSKKSNDVKILDRLRYVNCALEDLTLSEKNFEYYDAIVMSEVIEHVDNVEMFINNASKLLKVFFFINQKY